MSTSLIAGRHRLIVIGAAATLAAGTFAATNLAGAASGPSAVDYAQCQNGAPGTSPTPDCAWINGILNASGSQYHEDQVTPQRLTVSFTDSGAGPTTHSVTLRYLDRKGTIHAYDYLAAPDATMLDALSLRCKGIEAVCPGGSASTTVSAPDPNHVPSATGAYSDVVSTHMGGLSTAQKTIDLYGATFAGGAASTSGWPANTSPPAMTTPTHDCLSPCTGDDYATVTFSFTTSGAGGHNVQLMFGGHLAAASQTDGWGTGLGAGSVSGGPYHIKWDAADGVSVGNRDNQIMSGAILPIVSQGTTLATTATPSGDVVIGSTSLTTVHDQANLTVASTTHPPSSVATFSLYGPFSSAPTAATDCVDPGGSGTANRVAGPFTGGSWSEEGSTTTYDSDMAAADYVDLTGTTGFAAGKYYQWVVTYDSAGNDLYNKTSTSDCTVALERIHVIKATPTASSTQTITDKVTLSGGNSPGGTLDWYLYSTLADCTGDVTANAVATDVNGSPVSPDTNANNALSSGSATSKAITVTPDPGGTLYYWKVFYSGDSNNNGGVIEDCQVQEVTIQNAAA